jgi:hypothetical protein
MMLSGSQLQRSDEIPPLVVQVDTWGGEATGQRLLQQRLFRLDGGRERAPATGSLIGTDCSFKSVASWSASSRVRHVILPGWIDGVSCSCGHDAIAYIRLRCSAGPTTGGVRREH